MGMRPFVLGVILITAVGWCMIHETMRQTRARYLLAELAEREAAMKKTVERLRAEEESLMQPLLLEKKKRELRLDLVALMPMPPERAAHGRGGDSSVALRR